MTPFALPPPGFDTLSRDNGRSWAQLSRCADAATIIRLQGLENQQSNFNVLIAVDSAKDKGAGAGADAGAAANVADSNVQPLDTETKTAEQLKENSERTFSGTERRPGWVEKHNALVEKSKSSNAQLVFFGDSITEGMGQPRYMDAILKHLAQYDPDNFGIGGDTAPQLLWRLNHGELMPKAKLIVMLIGTNDLRHGVLKTAHEIAQNIVYCVQTIRLKCPSTKVLVMGILPRDKPDAPERLRLLAVQEEINCQISQLDNGSTIRYLDTGSKFKNRKGLARKDLLPDYLHPNAKGYDIWMKAIRPVVEDMMN